MARSRRKIKGSTTEIHFRSPAVFRPGRVGPEKTGILFGKRIAPLESKAGVVDVELPTSPAPDLFLACRYLKSSS